MTKYLKLAGWIAKKENHKLTVPPSKSGHMTDHQGWWNSKTDCEMCLIRLSKHMPRNILMAYAVFYHHVCFLARGLNPTLQNTIN